ncbi:MAG: hypothetical protein COB66_08845 [Coxiella sp. (in: Bacteria)]|nr:MAG: hypothetical protein COB66_08845 [Coxiella sp. (in: g-proteobacteria)]
MSRDLITSARMRILSEYPSDKVVKKLQGDGDWAEPYAVLKIIYEQSKGHRWTSEQSNKTLTDIKGILIFCSGKQEILDSSFQATRLALLTADIFFRYSLFFISAYPNFISDHGLDVIVTEITTILTKPIPLLDVVLQNDAAQNMRLRFAVSLELLPGIYEGLVPRMANHLNGLRQVFEKLLRRLNSGACASDVGDGGISVSAVSIDVQDEAQPQMVFDWLPYTPSFSQHELPELYRHDTNALSCSVEDAYQRFNFIRTKSKATLAFEHSKGWFGSVVGEPTAGLYAYLDATKDRLDRAPRSLSRLVERNEFLGLLGYTIGQLTNGRAVMDYDTLMEMSVPTIKRYLAEASGTCNHTDVSHHLGGFRR